MLSSSLHFGHLYVPVSGVCATLGLMAALGLSQVTARLARLDPKAVWDAELVIVLAAFVISRALLVAGSWRSFLASPWLVLSLPTLNDTGVLLTGLVGWGYLRWRKLPPLAFLDVAAPCASLVWAFLSLGHVLAGMKDGMPTRFFLAVEAGASGSVRLQPVELYTIVTALTLSGLLIRALIGHRQPGLVFAQGLVLAGTAVFLLDFLRVPSVLFAAAMLDPVQWVGLAMAILGCALFLALPAAHQIGTPDAV